MNDQRQFVRKTLSTQVTLFDKHTQQYTGFMVDYSDGGIMMACYQPLEVQKTYEFIMMDLPNNIGRKRMGHITLNSVWCKQISPTQFGVGFMLVEMDEGAKTMFASYDAEFSAQQGEQQYGSG